MAKERRRIRGVYKNDDGTISKVCNLDAVLDWSPRLVREVVEDIDNDKYEYYVCEDGYDSIVHTVGTSPNKYIRTYADDISMNNLENLEPCA